MFMSPTLNQSHDYVDLRTRKGWKLLGKKIWQYKWIYGAFDSDVKAKAIEIIAAGGDVDAQWDAFLKEMEPKWQPVAAELDANLK